MECPKCYGVLSYIGIFKTVEHRSLDGYTIMGDVDDCHSEDMDNFLICEDCDTEFTFDTWVGPDKREYIIDWVERKKEEI